MALFLNKKLARYPGIWRVDGVGPVRDNRRLGLIAKVYFSEVSELAVSKPYEKQSLTGQPLELVVHAASIREFKVGTLWREGKRIHSPGVIDDSFRILASSATLHPLSYRAKVADHWIDSVIPKDCFNFGENRQHLSASLYLLVPVIGNPKTNWLVVPCSEILRFYFSPSSRLLGKTVQGRLDDLVAWESSRMESLTAVIRALHPINRKEAALYARAVANPKSRSELLGVHQRLAIIKASNASRSASNKLPLTLDVRFPFDDETTLRVAGERILFHKATHLNERDQWAVFAMEILHCSRPFDFVKVLVEANWADPASRSDKGPSSPLSPKLDPLLNDDSDEIEINDRPADARLPRLATLTFTNQFDEFGRLTFERRYLSDGTNNSGHRNGIDVPINGQTLADGTFAEEGKGNLGVGDYQNRIEQVARELSLFLEMVDQLCSLITKKRGWMITTPTMLDAISHGPHVLSQFPHKLGSRRTWHLVTEPQGNRRPRQVAVVEVFSPTTDRRFYLIEMELRPEEHSGQCTILLHLESFGKLENPTFKDLLFLTAIRNRWPDKEDRWRDGNHLLRANNFFSNVVIHRFRHPSSPQVQGTTIVHPLDPTSWAERLLENIDDALGTFP